MADYWEIDFLKVDSSRSGDAIAIRYESAGQFWVHVVDCGYARDADAMARHLRVRYGTSRINHLVVTHPDQDHAEGVARLAELCDIEVIWMLRPWLYAPLFLDYFANYSSAVNLAAKLRTCYPYIDEIETIANRLGIEIREPFQDAQIGPFTVLAPSPARWGQAVINSAKTPRPAIGGDLYTGLFGLGRSLARLIKAGWGSEKFSAEATSPENEMSVVQFANFAGQTVVLTGDAGRDGLTEAYQQACLRGLMPSPRVTVFQAPHHGGRRNITSEILNNWCGPMQLALRPVGQELFIGVISASRDDPSHPRKAVRRGLHHRGAKLLTTEDENVWVWGGAVPLRSDYFAVPNNPYPDEQEDD